MGGDGQGESLLKVTPESRPEGDEGMFDTEVWGKARRKKGRAR